MTDSLEKRVWRRLRTEVTDMADVYKALAVDEASLSKTFTNQNDVWCVNIWISERPCVHIFIFNESQIEIEQAERFYKGNSVFNENTYSPVFPGSNNETYPLEISELGNVLTGINSVAN